MRTLQQPRAMATRDRIVKAAARCFALRGYHDTKIEQVQKAAAVTTGAFFHHFSTKEELGFAVLDRHMGQRRRYLRQIDEKLGPPSVDPLEQVFRRLEALRIMLQRRERRKGGCIIGNLSVTLSDTHVRFRRRLAGCFDEMALDFKPLLDAAAWKYCPGQNVNTKELAEYIVAVLEGSIMLARTRQDTAIIERHFELLRVHLKNSFAQISQSESPRSLCEHSNNEESRR